MSAKVSIIFFQLGESVSNVRGRGSVRVLEVKGGGLFGCEVTKVLPSPGSGFVELEGFKGVSGNNRHMMSEAFFTVHRHFKVDKDSSEEVTIGQRGGATHVCNPIHVTQDHGGIIN